MKSRRLGEVRLPRFAYVKIGNNIFIRDSMAKVIVGKTNNIIVFQITEFLSHNP